MKRLMSFKLIVFCLIFLLAGAIFIAPAQAQSPKLPTGDLPTDPHGYQITTDEMQAYYNAISDCSTPSLECLVRNVSRFTAIEWVQDINGPKGDCNSNPGGCNETSGGGGGKNIASGALGGLASLMGGMYARPPASTGTYIADVLNSAHVVTPAYAQGLGFASLDPVLNLWKTFRNIAYMFFVVIFVITGFLIMFRQKVGQAAITAQQAIPNIIISLLMVTFSYAIGGFLIDLMYLSMVLIIGIFQNLGSNDYLSMNIFGLGAALWKSIPDVSQLGDTIKVFLDSLTNGSNAANTVVSVFGGLTLSIILTIAMLIGLVKLFFELLRAYATIVVSIVTAPLTLMMNAMPGSNAFMTWIKTLVGHLLPFPTVLVVVAMFDVFVKESWGGGGFMPPFLLNGGQLNIIPSVLGLAILLALPEIVKHIREAIAPKNGFAEMVLGAAGKRFGKSADLSIPVGSAGATGLWGGLRGGISAAKTPSMRTPRGIWTGITQGVPIADPHHPGQIIGRRGGIFSSKDSSGNVMAGGLQRGWGRGQSIRKVIDDVADGRLFEPDNIRKQLENIAGAGKEKKTPASTRPPATP